MSFSMKPVRPCTLSSSSTPSPPKHSTTLRCCTITQPLRDTNQSAVKNWEQLLAPVDYNSSYTSRSSPRPLTLGKRWMEYQGIQNWDGLLDPLDDNLRREILRYGDFVEAAYQSFDFDPSSPTYATCRFPKNTLLDRSGLPQTGYRPTKHLRATSGINLPRWVEKAPNWVSTQSSWIGYVAVCQDKEEIKRLGRRDVVIAYRGTATCLEWLENLRATLTHIDNNSSEEAPDGSPAMVESGFLSLYTSSTAATQSLQDMIREEITRLLQTYGDEPLSLTITGHSLGAALATLTGFVIDEDDDDMSNTWDVHLAGLPSWIQKRVEDTQWAYAEVGRELRLSSRDSPYLNSINVATCHELKTYLHLVNGFVSSTCPFRATAKRVLNYYPVQK